MAEKETKKAEDNEASADAAIQETLSGSHEAGKPVGIDATADAANQEILSSPPEARKPVDIDATADAANQEILSSPPEARKPVDIDATADAANQEILSGSHESSKDTNNDRITIDDVKNTQNRVQELLKLGRSSISKSGGNDLDIATYYYEKGIECFYCNQLGKAQGNFDLAEHEIMKAFRPNIIVHIIVPYITTFIYLLIFFISLVYVYGMQNQLVFFGLKIPLMLGGIPLWSALSGLFGGSVRALNDLIYDKDTTGFVPEGRRLWIIVMPIIGLAFGSIAFILVNIGVLILGGSQPANSDNLVKVFLCFMAGYRTDYFDQKIMKLWEKVS
jgi:hypothetical protein